MVEVVTLVTAVVSAVAGAVSAWVAFAQWRESRAARAGSSTRGGTDPGRAGPADPAPVDPAPAPEPVPPVAGHAPRERPPTDWVLPRSVDGGTGTASAPPSRALAVAGGIGAVCLVLTAAALVAHARGDGAGPALDVAMLLGVVGAVLAAWVIVTPRSRTPRERRRAGLAFAGSLAPWVALSVIGLLRGLAA